MKYLFIVWKSYFHKMKCVSRCQGTEDNTEPQNKILFNHALEYGNSSHYLSKIWWDELVTNTQSLIILVPDWTHVLTSIRLIRIWHKSVVYVVSFSCINIIHFLFNISSAVFVYSSTYCFNRSYFMDIRNLNRLSTGIFKAQSNERITENVFNDRAARSLVSSRSISV